MSHISSVSFDSQAPLIMGVLNVTPDSFHDGGQFNQLDSAVLRAEQMVADGVDIIDIGGESTRPGAAKVSIEEECNRVLPVIKKLSQSLVVPISIDTRNTVVMQRALDAGASLINDVNALNDDGAVALAAERNVPVCLMHMQGLPQTMQDSPQYGDVFDEIYSYLEQRVNLCEQQGIKRKQIYIDPGFGFGKTLNHNLMLLGQLSRFKAMGCPLLVGLSRKSMFGKILNVETEDRLYGSLAGALLAVMQGADIVRTHDVKETRDIIKVYEAVKPFWQTPQTPRSQHEHA
tara:strand:- start:36889 stop:37755 length:867 start_codon:yes stop_codon:yes gene_type:complete